MKKLCATLLLIALSLSLCACGETAQTAAQTDAPSSPSEDAASAIEETALSEPEYALWPESPETLIDDEFISVSLTEFVPNAENGALLCLHVENKCTDEKYADFQMSIRNGTMVVNGCVLRVAKYKDSLEMNNDYDERFYSQRDRGYDGTMGIGFTPFGDWWLMLRADALEMYKISKIESIEFEVEFRGLDMTQDGFQCISSGKAAYRLPSDIAPVHSDEFVYDFTLQTLIDNEDFSAVLLDYKPMVEGRWVVNNDATVNSPMYVIMYENKTDTEINIELSRRAEINGQAGSYYFVSSYYQSPANEYGLAPHTKSIVIYGHQANDGHSNDESIQSIAGSISTISYFGEETNRIDYPYVMTLG